MILHHRCSHIRKSAGHSLFAAHRSLSQLVTSFFGSQCQGILHILFFAWTTLSKLSLLPGSSFLSRLNCCVSYLQLQDLVFYLRLAKLFQFLPLRKNLISIFFFDFLFPFTFVCHVCHTNSFEFIWFTLIRFSMNIPLTTVKVHSTFAELLSYLTLLNTWEDQRSLDPRGLSASLSFSLPKIGCRSLSAGLKWTRTTDLALIRRAL